MEQKAVAGKLIRGAGILLMGILFALLLVLCQSPGLVFKNSAKDPEGQPDLAEEQTEGAQTGPAPAFHQRSAICPVGMVWAGPPSGSSAVVLERDSLRVLYEQDAYLRRPMASTTKIVTALVAIEQCRDLDQKREIPDEAVGIEGSSIYLRKGEHLSMRELLYGLMLRSGNDCAVAVASLTAGSVEQFVLLMNQKAADLRCTDTHFCNPHGLHDPDHYTTAYDLAVLTAAALKNPVFREIVGTQKITISNEGTEADRVLINKNKLLTALPGATGVKTGFTKAAGRCLVASCEREGMECISVVLNCGPMWEVSESLLERALTDYRMDEILVPYECVGELNREQTRLPLFCRETFSYPLRAGEREALSFRLETGEGPFRPGEPVGKIKIYLENDLIFSAKLYTMEEIEQQDFLSALFRIFRKWIVGRQTLKKDGFSCVSTSFWPSAASAPVGPASL